MSRSACSRLSRIPGAARCALRRASVLVALGTVMTSSLAAQARPSAAPRASLDSSASQPARLRSWTSDNYRYAIGDIVTVLVVNRTSAAANVRDVAADARRKTLGADVQPPASPTGPSVPISADVRFDQAGDSRRSGEMLRGNEFRTTVTTRVVAISPTGMLRLEGRSTLQMDRNRQDVVVKGWIRPQDVAPGAHVVESSRLADASITYTSKGSLGKPRSGIVSRVLGMVWP
ncbi:MAG: flagellar basal body L-ring protein FlgH [Gemmatimonadetes bacterium]|nr:flagellar basal body L-ring protein FlgH [Gemmatimonadota bacterium]